MRRTEYRESIDTEIQETDRVTDEEFLPASHSAYGSFQARY